MSGKTKAWTIGLTALTAAVVAGAVAFAQVRHEPRGSIYGPYYNPHIFNNGTGTISDTLRDPHNDR